MSEPRPRSRELEPRSTAMELRLGWVMLVLALVACGEPASELDGGAGVDGSVRVDAGGSVDSAIDAQISADAMAGDATAGDAAVDAGSIEPSDDSGVDGGADGGADAGTNDAGTDAGALDAGQRVFQVRVLADSACSTLSFDPASISVPAGTSFTVDWINATGCTEIDIDKSGTVPIVIGLEPGTSYHDTIREWCGTFTGTFSFRAYYAPSFPYYLDVDCSG